MSQPRDDRQDDLFRPPLNEIINLRHPLVRLAGERRLVNKAFLQDMAKAWQKHGMKALEKCAKNQPAAFCKMYVLLVPREMKVEHSNELKEFTDEQLEEAIAAVRAMLDQKAGDLAKVIEATAEPAALSAPTALDQPRRREYLTEKEIERLMKAAGDNRYGHRDATMILLAFRHGLRASELCSLRWEQVDLTHGRLHVTRTKNGIDSVHPLTGSELRALRRLQREQEQPGRYVFMSERGAPMSAVGFRRMITRLGAAAKMPFQIHPQMLRHACGYILANRGVDTRALQHYLGHKNIQHTVRYTELSPDRFRDFWRD